MNNEEILTVCAKQTVEMTKHGKTEVCRDNKGASDVPPFVVVGMEVQDDDGNQAIGGGIIQMDLENGNHPVDELPYVLSDLHQEGMTDFMWLMFVTEGYARRTDITDITEADLNAPRGTLEKEFAEKPDTNICEGIIATLFAKSGEAVTATCFYKYGDDGLPVYEEAEYTYCDGGDENKPQGLVADTFGAFMKYCEAWDTLNEASQAVQNSDNPLFTKEDVASLDMKKMPNFLTVWQVFTDDLPNSKKVAKKMKEQVAEFMSKSFMLKVTKECWQAITDKSEKGELDLDAFMAKMEIVMTGTDEEAKENFIAELTKSYSVSAQALMFALGKSQVPDDISGLVG
jgi:hypothetical protein